MAKLKILAGTTSKIVRLFIQNSTSSTGAGLTGLTSATSGLVAYYLREGAAGPATAISLSAGTVGSWSNGGFAAADSTNLPGVYELGLPNAALASGAQSVIIMLQGAANMVPTLLEVELDAVNYQSNTGFVSSVPAVVGAVGSVTAAVPLPANAPSGFLANDTTAALIVSNQGHILGLVGENQGIRNQQYDSNVPPNLLSCDICYYSTAGNATTNDGATGLVHKWSLSNTYTSGVLTAQSIRLVS